MAVPKIIPYDVELRSVNPVRSFDRPKAYTNDRKSVEFQFKILDMTSTDLETATAITLVYMRDGSFFANPSTDVKRVGNVFSYLLKENEGNHAGVAQIQLVVTIDDAEFASQLFDFEIINGLETKVAQEVMIYDWTTLTRDARAYIDEFVANEVFRDAQFENAQFDRNVAFVSSQESRALAFGVEQTNRGEAFTTEQTNRNTAFTNDQDARALTFSESESGRTTAETGRVTAESNRVTAETGRTTAESNRVTAENNRVTAESGRVTAESGRVTAESARVIAETNRASAFTAFDTRLTAEETATANNKISAVKGKTFADVDARFEDVEFDTTVMGTNLVTNGDFSNGSTGWTTATASLSVVSGVLNFVVTSRYGGPQQTINGSFGNKKIYMAALVKFDTTSALVRFTDEVVDLYLSPKVLNVYERVSAILQTSSTATSIRIKPQDNRESAWTTQYVDNVITIDLTATFGAGNEPTVEQMDSILAKFPNSWFNGTANLFRANATLNKLMAVDARTEFEAKNLVVNGNFASDVSGDGIADGWLAQGTLINASILNNIQKFTPSVQYASVRSLNGLNLQQNSKYYISGYVKGPLQTVLQISDLGMYTYASVTVADAFNKLSCIYSKTTPSSTGAVVAVQYNATSGFGEIQAKYITLIDLTATFGAGKEPTLAEMDRLMARFPNSWFDGVKPIQTIETLYQEKANKVSEAWITPTFLNGWTEVSGYPVRYMKDEMGFVHLKGKITGGSLANRCLTLPSGYRPFERLTEIVAGGNSSITYTPVYLFIQNDGGVAPQTGTNSEVSLDSIIFKAEA